VRGAGRHHLIGREQKISLLISFDRLRCQSTPPGASGLSPHRYLLVLREAQSEISGVGLFSTLREERAPLGQRATARRSFPDHSIFDIFDRRSLAAGLNRCSAP
jgi:hypothetical protein